MQPDSPSGPHTSHSLGFAHGFAWNPCQVIRTSRPAERIAWAQAPGSSYIWLSGKVTSNLPQIPNDFSLKSSIPDRVYHMTSRKGNPRDQPPESLARSERVCHFYVTLPGYFSSLYHCLAHSTTRDLDFEGTLSSLENLLCCGQRQPVSLHHVCQNFCLSSRTHSAART